MCRSLMVTSRHFGSNLVSLCMDVRASQTQRSSHSYLRHAFKGGSAKYVIDGLSRTGDHYNKAIACLQSRYDKPHAPDTSGSCSGGPHLKDGSGSELRRLHDAAQQHLWALKALGHEPSGSFNTSLYIICSKCQHFK